jgi:hypothetical protein
MNIFKHPCNTCFIKPICKEPECVIVKDHYKKINGNLIITHILLSTFLIVFMIIPFSINSHTLVALKHFNLLTVTFYMSCTFILSILTIFIMYKDIIKRKNQLDRMTKFLFKKVKE